MLKNNKKNQKSLKNAFFCVKSAKKIKFEAGISQIKKAAPKGSSTKS